MLKLSRARRRSWPTLLACAGLLATSGVAHADTLGTNTPQVDPFGIPGQTVDVPAGLRVDFGGTSHLTSGGAFTLSMDAGASSPYAIYSDETFTLPDPWTTGGRFNFQPQLKFTMPDTVGYSEHLVRFNAQTDACEGGFGDCLTGSPRTIMLRAFTRPRPTSAEEVSGDNTGISLTWAHSPDRPNITGYFVERTDVSARTASRIWFDNNTTSLRDTQAEPGKQYCYTVRAYWQQQVSPNHFLESDPSSLVCAYLNRAPGAPGAPSADPDLTNGPTTVSWTPASEPDGNTVTYTLQHQDADDGDNWSTVHQGFVDTELPVNEQGGTWRYRVRATDQHGIDGPWSEIGPEHKADNIGPGVPKLSYDKTPAPGNWFKDSVTVSFSDAVDSVLPDGSPGSGVGPEGYPAPITFDIHGPHRVAEIAIDRVGNEGAMVPTWVNVDAMAPEITVTGCPTARVLEGTPVELTYDASDEGSGLAEPTPASGTVALDTDTAGDHVRTVTARDNVGHETSTTCEYTVYTNSPPPTPAAPSVPDDRRDGQFGVTWDGVTDPDPEDTVDYVAQQRDADTDWTDVGGRLSTAELAADVAEGTWQFRVKAIDSHDAESGWSDPSTAVKVDQGNPTAVASTNPANDIGGWFKDSVTVSFGDSTDPNLGDGSLGTGIASVTEPQTFDTTGTHTATGTATDNVGNVSAETAKTVKVDATAPAVICPATTVIAGQPNATMSWTASDDESGLSTAASGTVPLDTSMIGMKSVTIPTAKDNVGHETAKTCDYTVTLRFVGFGKPVITDGVNKGKGGRTYPVKWQLQMYDGKLISDSDAQALLTIMSVGVTSVDCGAFGTMDAAALEEETTTDTSLRYDAKSHQYIYNYKSPKGAGCHVLSVRRADGVTTKRLNFEFTG